MLELPEKTVPEGTELPVGAGMIDLEVCAESVDAIMLASYPGPGMTVGRACGETVSLAILEAASEDASALGISMAAACAPSVETGVVMVWTAAAEVSIA